MAADILAGDMKSRLNLTTKTVGAERIRRAKENNEDIAVLSMFLPGSSAKEENSRFRCDLGYECRLNDPKLATPGRIIIRKKNINVFIVKLMFFSFNEIISIYHIDIV